MKRIKKDLLIRGTILQQKRPYFCVRIHCKPHKIYLTSFTWETKKSNSQLKLKIQVCN